MCWAIQDTIHWVMLGQAIHRAMLYGQYTIGMLSIGWVGEGQCTSPMTMCSDANTTATQCQHYPTGKTRKVNAACRNITFEMQYDTHIDTFDNVHTKK